MGLIGRDAGLESGIRDVPLLAVLVVTYCMSYRMSYLSY